MNKVKWSFSLILALFLVGILSTAAFASVMYTLNTVQNGSDLDVSFTGNTSNGDHSGEEFDLLLKNGSTTVGNPYQATLNGDLNGSFTIPLSAITPSKTSYYTVELYYSDAQGNATGSTLARLVVSHNNTLYQEPDSHVDVNGDGLLNSNGTGFNNIKKQRTGQKMHGFYQNNTNSCASCHQTHTATSGASDDALLFKDGTYSTCSACHDGTTGADNTFSPTTSSTPDSVSGTFNVAADAAHGSLHQADGSLQVSAAPGGNDSTDSSETSSSLYKATWGQIFDCASCHNPHGGGSNGENNLNEDPLGWGKVKYVSAHDGGSQDQQNGKLFTGRTIYTSVPASFAAGNYDTYILVSTTAGAVNAPTSDTTKLGYLYYRAGVKDGSTPIIQTYRWDGTEYTPDYSLWLRDTGYESAPFSQSNTVLYNGDNGTGTDITTGAGTDITVVWARGFAYGSGVSAVKSYTLSVGIDVEGTDTDAASLYDPTDPNYVPYSGTEMSLFCASCHTDYLTDPQTGSSGVLTAEYRHTEVSDQLTCVRCHFAHGTDNAIMKDATSGNNATKSTDTLSNVNHSSALRRYIDMDSCYASGCHSKSPTDPMYLEWSY